MRHHRNNKKPKLKHNFSEENRDYTPELTISGMDNLVNQHKTPHKLDVYTGINEKHARALQTAAENSKTSKFKMVHPAFLSTSIDKRIAHGFGSGEHVIHIKVPKGHPGAYVEKHSSLPGEKEFILPRGHVLNIDKTPTTETWGVLKRKRHIWHATIVPKKSTST